MSRDFTVEGLHFTRRTQTQDEDGEDRVLCSNKYCRRDALFSVINLHCCTHPWCAAIIVYSVETGTQEYTNERDEKEN